LIVIEIAFVKTNITIKTININFIFNLQSSIIQIYNYINNILTIKTNIETIANI